MAPRVNRKRQGKEWPHLAHKIQKYLLVVFLIKKRICMFLCMGFMLFALGTVGLSVKKVLNKCYVYMLKWRGYLGNDE